ncbi:MAG: hypothetical protein ACE5G0_15710 [Rhodothermales bacterium]
MKRIIIAVVAGLLAFIVGLGGMYYAMPALAPERVEEAQAMLDSLALADSLTSVERAGLEDSTATTIRSIGQNGDSPGVPDSSAVSDIQPDSSQHRVDAATDTTDAPVEADAALQDSLAKYRSQVASLITEKSTLLAEIQTLKQQQGEQQARSVEVQELSTTLTKLEDKELAQIVEQLDMAILQDLYHKASSRNRARLLQAMQPQAAADFVRRMVQQTTSVTDLPLGPDSTTSAGRDNDQAPTANE